MSVKILVGDVFDRLRALPDESVHMVVSSPPYWGLRSYLTEDDPNKRLEIGLEPTLGEHLDVMVRVFREVRRVLRADGTCWVNYGDCYATQPNGRSAADTKAAGNDDRTFRDKPFSTVGGLLKAKDLVMAPNRLAIALQEDGWWVRSEIVWGKPNAMPDSSGKYRPSTAHEKIFMLTKSAKCFYDHGAVALACSEKTNSRVAKKPDNWDTGEGAHGSFHRQGREKGATTKQDGHGRRHAGFNDRYFGAPGVTPKSAAEDTNVRAKGSFHALTTGAVETRYLRNYEPAPSQVWEMASQAFPDAHFATFPPELAERCIKAGCPVGGVVLDPFFGAGTTGLVADRLGRDCIGIELNPEYAAMAERRIKADGPLFAKVARAAE